MTHRFLSRWLSCWLVLLAVASASTSTSLEQGFAQPPHSAAPWVYWIWVDGNVSREGIRADLEDMRRAGIGGAMLFDGGFGFPSGPVRYGSPEWRECVQYAFTTARELGLEIVMMNSAGWATSGGPWNRPEDSMKMLVWSEQRLAPGASWSGPLAPPPSQLGFYRDVAVLAIPEAAEVNAVLTSDAPGINAALLEDGRATTMVTFKAPAAITLDFGQPVSRRRLELELARGRHEESTEGLASDADVVPGGLIEASDDGKTFRSVHRFADQRQEFSSRAAISFPPTTARYFRVTFRPDAGRFTAPWRLAELRMADVPRVAELPQKTGLKSEPREPTVLAPDALAGEFASADVIDLTDKLQPDGSLNWTPPANRAWTLLRLGYTTSARTNHPAPPEGEGLEVDKFDAAAVTRQLEHALGPVLTGQPAGAHAGLTGLLCDSWEAGPQTWTQSLPEEFKARRGYELRPFLPALTGRVVGTTAETEAFLADYRRTLGELFAEKYYGTIQRGAHARGLEFFAEVYGGVFDEARALAAVDHPMVEFWAFGLYKGFDHAPAMAHLLGRPAVMAEAFTSRPPRARWTEYPFGLKAMGDAAFIAGINQFVLHSYVQQPRADVAPGFTHGRYGAQFGRLNSWWPLVTGWTDYLRRCQFLLQQGQPVADLLILDPERLQSEFRELPVPIVPGYRSDLLPPWLLSKLTVNAGVLVAPSGARYRVLVLPSRWVAGLATLQELRRLVAAGAIVVGEPPQAPSGWRELREEQSTWQALVQALWPNAGPGVRRMAAVDALAQLNVGPDFRAEADGRPINVQGVHRTSASFDLYFVSNQQGCAFPAEAEYRYATPPSAGERVSATLEFRVTGRVPELWDPATGRRTRVWCYAADEHGTRFQLTLGPAESVFVVFREPAPASHPVSVTRADHGRAIATPQVDDVGKVWFAEAGEYQVRYADGTERNLVVPVTRSAQPLPGPWTLRLSGHRQAPPPLTLDRLSSWTEQANPEIKFFSGIGSYETTFTLAERTANEPVLLDLGQVCDLAAVTLNGHAMGTLWKPPFVVDVSSVVRSGANTLKVEVANRWVNRLIGDEQLPAELRYQSAGGAGGPLREFPTWWRDPLARRERVAFSTWSFFTADSPLLPSGLLGPVVLRFPATVTP